MEKYNLKIILIIFFQILIIVSSFLILEILETERTFNANSVNISGKNRLLTLSISNEVKNSFLNDSLDTHSTESLELLEQNLLLLHDGGVFEDITIKPLSDTHKENWREIFADYQILKGVVEKSIKSNDIGQIQEIDKLAKMLVAKNDVLTNNLSLHSQELSTDLINIQIFLSIFNISMHILLIFILIRIMKIHYTKESTIERLSLLGKFAASMAHDIRNPLATISGNVSILKLDEPNPLKNRKDAFDRIDRSISRISHQIEFVMEYVRGTPLSKSEQHLRTILVNTLENVPVPDNVEVLLPKSNPTLFCDPKKLSSVFENLFLNSIQAMKDGGKITIKLAKIHQDLLIYVEDTGEGIPDDDLEKIFELLYTTKKQGSGIGLFICKQVIEQHGGTISIKNNPTTFTISIPTQGQSLSSNP